MTLSFVMLLEVSDTGTHEISAVWIPEEMFTGVQADLSYVFPHPSQSLRSFAGGSEVREGDVWLIGYLDSQTRICLEADAVRGGSREAENHPPLEPGRCSSRFSQCL